MRATYMYGAGDVLVVDVPDPIVKEPTDAIVRVVRLHTSCRCGGFWNSAGVGGGQAEAVRVPLADGTLVAVPVEETSALIPSLLTLSDVYGTGYHAAIKANVNPRTTVTPPMSSPSGARRASPRSAS
ncbi:MULTISPECIES: hypothetical protein [unclassified Kribbella]|uniref:hypothetical protein n=1 Tax=unclassified Kribbella TaxID=2644121 RepID=UPI00340D3BA9